MCAKKAPVFSCGEAASGCGEASAADLGDSSVTDFAESTFRVLEDQGAIASFEEQGRLIDHLSVAARRRKVVARLWSTNRKTNDIIGLIQMARDAGDLDEAIWRCLLAAHFGQASADEDHAHIASDVLCAFADEPYWTWQRVRETPNLDGARVLEDLVLGLQGLLKLGKRRDLLEEVEAAERAWIGSRFPANGKCSVENQVPETAWAKIGSRG